MDSGAALCLGAVFAATVFLYIISVFGGGED